MKDALGLPSQPRGQRDRIRAMRNTGTATTARSQFNFIEGANITLAVADSATNDRIDITITGSGAGGLGDPGSNGIVVRTALNTTVARTLVAPAAGLTITNPDGTGGNPTFALADDLAALEGLASTGLACHIGANTWIERSVSDAGSGRINVTNPRGVAGNIILDVVEANLDVASMSGTLLVSHGGTGQFTWAAGDMLYSTGNPSILTALAIGASATYLRSNGSIPQWVAATANDDFTQYTKLAGRTGTTNDTLLSTTVDGTLTGSHTTGKALILKANDVNTVDSLTSGAVVKVEAPLQFLTTAASPAADLFLATFNTSVSPATTKAITAFQFNPTITTDGTNSIALFNATPVVNRTSNGGAAGLITPFYTNMTSKSSHTSKPQPVYGFDCEAKLDHANSSGTPSDNTGFFGFYASTTASKSVSGGSFTIGDWVDFVAKPVAAITGTLTVTHRAGVWIRDISQSRSASFTVTSLVGLDIDDFAADATGAPTYTTTTRAGIRSALTSANGNVFLLDTGGAPSKFAGKFTQYNNVATVADGMAYQVATYNGTALVANDNAGAARTIYPAPSDGFYRLTAYTSIATAAGTSSTRPSVTVGWTDANSVAQTNALIATNASNSTTGATATGSITVYAKAGTNITTTSAGYASSGAPVMAYDLHVRVEQLG